MPSALVNDTLIQSYFAENIVHMDLAAPMRTTIAATPHAADAGNDYAVVVNAAPFVMEGTATWWDTTSEQEIAITSVDLDANILHFDRPLTTTHAAGAMIATNVFDYAPDEYGFQLRKGNPVIFAESVGSTQRWNGMRLANGPTTIQVQYNVLDEQPDGMNMHPNLWVKEQKARCKDALGAILTALIKNNHLNTPTRDAIAQRIGAVSRDEIAQTVYGQFLLVKEDVPVFAAATHVIVIPRPMSK